MPDQIPTQDLTPELVRDWMESACLDAAVDEDDDVLVNVDGTRLGVRVLAQDGLVAIWCLIRCDEDTEADVADWLDAVNRTNRSTFYVRAVLQEDCDGNLSVRYEHELFALDGIVARRQLVKLVRRIKTRALEHHDSLHEMVA